MHRARGRGGGFWRNALLHTQYYGRQVDNFFRTNGNRIRDIAATVAPLLAPENPALAAGVAAIGQGAASYSTLRDQLG